MKKIMKEYWKVILLVVIVCIVTIVATLKIGRYFMLKNFITHNASFIWVEKKYSEDGYETKLYQYGPNSREILLEDRYEFRDFICSKDNERLLSFIGDRERFAIVEYDINSQQLNRILELEEIDSFLDENGYEKSVTQREGRCVRYYDDEKKISFIYDKYIMSYSKQEGLEVIYSMKTSLFNEYSWLDDDVTLMIREDNNLVKYNAVTGEKEILAEGVQAFAPSEDGKFVILEDKNKTTWKYELESGKTKKLHQSSTSFPILRISEDNRYLLYNNVIRDMGSSKDYICIIDIENGKKVYIKKWKYSSHVFITGVAWR